MAPPMDVNQQTAADMGAARSRTSISVQIVRNYLYGGQKQWDLRERLEKILIQEQLFGKQQREFLGRTDQYIRATAITNRLNELRRIHSWSAEEYNTATSLLSEILPISLHDVAFQPVFLGQGSPALMENYWDLVNEKGIQGCYLQTELGHGTNVARLETTSTYIPETQEFEINSPSLTSTKWWIGALGKSATHGAVQAKLILPNGKDTGPHLFFVQLRSLEDHKPLPGIIVGDIGPKAGGGMAAQDQGFARFDHVRIPRTNMFSKFAEVTKEGNYIQPPHAKLSYGGMMYIRAGMIPSAAWTIARAATVAIRYTTVRRQGELDTNGLERQVLNYPSTYYRLLPILSRAFVLIELGRYTVKALDEMQQRLANRDTSLLPEMHALLCGLKVLVSTHGVSDIETARRSMGGHGYSAFAGLGRLYIDYLPAATFEGDNFVLDGQVVRAATKLCNAVLSSTSAVTKLPPPSAYLRLLSANSTPAPVTASTWHDVSSVVFLLEWRAALMVKNFTQTQGKAEVDANINQRLAKAVTEAFVAVQVGEMINNLTTLPSEDANVVGRLYRLYLLTTAESALVDLFSVGLIHPTGAGDPTQDLRLAIKALCLGILPNAIGLTDAFGFSDWSLDSALGVSDGRVYEALWQRV
ncbi:hypothetical protein AZE42_09596 [Rhizopogon vesiculosus]|uniref:Acyl-coenzyme A oxidase n=1 Tax=Rhizopogon vesiculosus TaxID=180088 RepID=A0A1J8QKR2_9AGAM|nr:hypothetical protein AZE42_09596 [Rhizopogon vesiculosus]